jgi:hypothetical protein
VRRIQYKGSKSPARRSGRHGLPSLRHATGSQPPSRTVPL